MSADDIPDEVERDDRPIRYIDSDADGRPYRVVYRASSLGGCERAFVACASGEPASPFPDWFQEVLDEGTNAEAAIDAWWEAATSIPTMLRQQELILTTAVEAEVKFQGEVLVLPVVVKAHVDGFATPASEQDQVTVREYKKFRPSTYPNWKRQGVEVHGNYPWQISAVMNACAQMSDGGKTMPLVEMVGALWGHAEGEDPKKVGAHVLEVAPQFYDVPPIPMRAINKKLARIEGLIADGYTAQDAEVQCDEKSYPCPYWKLHKTELAGGKDRPALVKLRVEVDHEINALLIREQGLTGTLKGIAEDQKKVTQARNEVRKKIAEFLDEHKVDERGGTADINGVVVERVWQERTGYEVKPSTVQYVQVKPADAKAKKAAAAKVDADAEAGAGAEVPVEKPKRTRGKKNNETAAAEEAGEL